MSKKIYKAILIVLSLFFVIDLTCTPITLEKWRNRVSDTPNLSSSIKKEIEIETKTMSEIDLLKYSLKKTSDILQFDRTNNINKGKANCVGYAQTCSFIFNYACSINNVSHCKATPVIGTVKYGKINLCNILQSIVPKEWKNFVKDHDFVQYNIDSETIYADPTAKDLINSSFTTYI